MKSLQVVLCLRFGGLDPMSPQNISHALVGDLVTQIGQCSDDAIVPPTRVLTCQFQDQLFDYRINSWAAGQSAFLRAVELLSD